MQVRDLKQELAMRDTLEGREASSYDELEEAEVQEINGLMRQVRRHHPAFLARHNTG